MTVAELVRTNRRELARLLTRVENGQADSELAALYADTGQARIIGVTGAPGTGKSSLVNALAKHYRNEGRRVAIVAVDPTSPFTGGAILGDRIRMRDLAGDPDVFIRSMASRGNLGGLARTTADAIRVLDAAGFEVILVETVGAGQGEVDIAGATQTTLVIEAPGLGDNVQAIKAGILEIADILVVNKADNPAVENTIRALRTMLDLGHRVERTFDHGHLTASRLEAGPQIGEEAVWQVPILQTVATEGIGIADLAARIAAHGEYLRDTGTLVYRDHARIVAEVLDRLREALLERQLGRIAPDYFAQLIDNVQNKQITPHQAVEAMLRD
ncbi:MAG TPA: methylmalonyl Co-A mutase-associated GTPase MeaB [Aggregatilineales bacterium]|nr:methylmalonyl Co-A mutase-associated GTPase MeaB [Aggregatilineales bacterium]